MSATEDSYDSLLREGVDAALAKRLDEAEDLLERALELRPGDVQAMNMLGWVFWSRGEAEEGERYYRATLEIDGSNPHARKGLGLCLVERGLLEEGIAEVKRAIDLRRNWAEPYHDLAMILVRNDRYAEAWPLVDVATKLEPELLTKLGDLYGQIRARARSARSSKG